jgi:zinc-finger of transposase IS204/IS1001/IS1096/IS1165
MNSRGSRMAALLAAHGWSIVALGAEPEGTLLLHIEPTCSSQACPMCGTPNSRRHSCYWRRPRDLPWRGHAVRLQIHVRRFYCDAAHCPRRTFAERFDGLVPPRAQRSDAATSLLREIALSVGGEGGARVAPAAWRDAWGCRPAPIRSCGFCGRAVRARCRPRGCWASMTAPCGGASAMPRSCSTSNGAGRLTSSPAGIASHWPSG